MPDRRPAEAVRADLRRLIKSGMPQTALADKMGISQPHLSKILKKNLSIGPKVRRGLEAYLETIPAGSLPKAETRPERLIEELHEKMNSMHLLLTELKDMWKDSEQSGVGASDG